MFVTRFAPSPTGFLHVGNVRTALIAYLYAKQHDGKFILRIDDTDQERSKEVYTDAILDDLKWLGLDWDELIFQSARLDLYEAARKRLVEDGRLYPCYESKEELEVNKKFLLSRNLPPIYDRSALKLTKQQQEDLQAQGCKPHWRFFLKPGDIDWLDKVRGGVHFQSKNLSDPVLIRADGSMTYSLASVVDDIDLGITDIIRGEDHISNSAIHIQLFEALGSLMIPNFAHISLLKSQDGNVLSKRAGGFTVRSLQELGIEVMAILSLLAKIGSSDAIEYERSHEDLIAKFDLRKYSKSATKYDISAVERLNNKIIHNMSYGQARVRLLDLGIDYIDELFWQNVHKNLYKFTDIITWYKVINDQVQIKVEDKELLAIALSVLPDGDWGSDIWQKWVNDIMQKTPKRGKFLFLPMRIALTGLEYGPELKNILPLIGREKVIARLSLQLTRN